MNFIENFFCILRFVFDVFGRSGLRIIFFWSFDWKIYVKKLNLNLSLICMMKMLKFLVLRVLFLMK